MPPQSGGANVARLDELERRLDRTDERMDKYDEIIADLHKIVVALQTQSATNYKWVTLLLTLGATIIGATAGAFASHLLH